MMQLANSRRRKMEINTKSYQPRDSLKSEMLEDFVDDEIGHFNKRVKFSTPSRQWEDPFKGPSPLGLQLRKSPSLLELIGLKLSQGPSSSNVNSLSMEAFSGAAASGNGEKLKASNFNGSGLKIGTWEYKSKHAGDLVAKMYFAKQKIVWEVMEDGLKSKIEIQWSDIRALHATFSDDGPGILTIALFKRPHFYKEINPQPRKHTLWQTSDDFTGGQASMHRVHILQSSQGLMDKHFEKLIQSDAWLHKLSQHPEIMFDAPFFDAPAPCYVDLEEHKYYACDKAEMGQGYMSSGFQNHTSLTSGQSSSLCGTQTNCMLQHASGEVLSPNSVMDTRSSEGSGASRESGSIEARIWEEIKLPGLHPSISMNDLMNHIENQISEKIAFVNPPLPATGPVGQGVLDEIAEYLLQDNHPFTTDFNDESLMSRVDSLCCLLQLDPIVPPTSQYNGESSDGWNTGVQPNNMPESMHLNKARDDNNKPSDENIRDDASSSRPKDMSRKDSYEDLLYHLPRIASFSNLLYDITEED